MSRRKASDAGGSVLSFTFLDVLMCTMGSLLLLLVLFGVIVKKSTRARREGEQLTLSLAALTAPDAPAQTAAAAAVPPAGDAKAVDEMSQQLARLRGEQAEIERLRGEAAQRRLEEQARIAHIEDHERRLEHELAQLHITLEVLEATEQKQTVDQAQAEAEVVRLKELIAETENRLDKMRKAGTGQKSYAIVPYKGANGTFRRPVFVECTADAVTIQPEGIRLTVEDFDGPLRSGNPLAAAIRAAHEELNGRAAAAGRTDLPDPYPLLIVRPDGAAAYAAAIDAIRSWDSDYGYEFVEADWKLKYPELDPRLAQVMAHAVDEARQRQALLAKVAPRQYGSRLGGSGDGGGGGGGDGFGELTSTGGGNRIGSHAGDGAFGGGRDAGGNSLRSGGSGGRYGSGGGTGEGNFSDEFAASEATAGGALTTGSGTGNGAGGGSGVGGAAAAVGTAGPGSTAGGPGVAGATGQGPASAGTDGANGQFADASGGQAGQAGASGTNAGQAGASTAPAGQAGGSAGSTGGGASSGGSSTMAAGAGSGGGGAGGAPTSSGGNTGMGLPSIQVGSKGGSIADKRGANWANAEAARRTSAITRPVRVVVRPEQLAIIPEGGTEADATIVPFKQPVDRVVDQLAGAVQSQVADWGLAGDAMYWRPTLVVTVAPGAQRQAERLAELLDNSGLDVRLPQATANASPTERQ